MPFRADEAAEDTLARAIHYIAPHPRLGKARGYAGVPGGDGFDWERAQKELRHLVECHGPVIDTYPSWHYLARLSHPVYGQGHGSQGPGCIQGLDHTVCFRNAMLTCPYAYGLDTLIPWLKEYNSKQYKLVNYPRMLQWKTYPTGYFYHIDAEPVLITGFGHRQDGDTDVLIDGTLSPAVAGISMLEEMLDQTDDWQCSEAWESVRDDVLGTPCGALSSLFVNQDTGRELKRAYELVMRIRFDSTIEDKAMKRMMADRDTKRRQP